MKIAITFDIDWAPDWCVAMCRDICAAHQAHSSFFATHKCDILDELQADQKVELGIHPNFLPGSSHGSDTLSVINHVLDIVPDALSIRTHSLVQSSPILEQIVLHTNIQNDVSLFMPFVPNRFGSKMYFGDAGKFLKRMPYYWEDDTAAGWPGWNWDRDIVLDESAEFLIFNFHPIHIGLNTANMEGYNRLKQSLAGKHLSAATRAECEPFVNRGSGAMTFLRALLRAGASADFRTISQLAATTAFADLQ